MSSEGSGSSINSPRRRRIFESRSTMDVSFWGQSLVSSITTLVVDTRSRLRATTSLGLVQVNEEVEHRNQSNIKGHPVLNMNYTSSRVVVLTEK